MRCGARSDDRLEAQMSFSHLTLRQLFAAVMIIVLALQACVLPAAAQGDPTSNVPASPASADSPEANYSLSGRVLTPTGDPVSGVTVTATTTRPPLIFIPGIGGSILRKQGKDWPLWPNVLEPDDKLETVISFLTGNLALQAAAKVIMNRMAGSASDLVLSPDADYATDVTAPDVIRWVVNTGSWKIKDIYGSFLEDFLQTQQGYRPYQLTAPAPIPGDGCDASQASNLPTLFVFPYDWRLPPERSAQRLASYIDCIQSFYPGTSIDIVAHSMGGLVARRYILDQVNAGKPSHIRRMITLGTPWLGAPKLLNVMLTGDFDFAVNLALINKDVLKQLIRDYPGAHTLLPSKKYIQDAVPDTRFFALLEEQGWDLNGNGFSNEVYDYPTYTAWLNAYSRDSAPATRNEQFHGALGQDNWSGDMSGVEYQHIIGSAPSTIAGIISREFCLRVGPTCIGKRFFDVKIPTNVWGDGTVPLPSGVGNMVPSTESTPVQYYYTFGDVFSTSEQFEHGKLPLDALVQECVIDIIDSGICYNSLNAAQLATQAGTSERYEIFVVGSGSANVVDSAGNITGWVDDFAMLNNIPAVNYYDTGGDAVRITAPATEPFTITFKSADSPLFVEVLKSSGDSVVNAVRYVDLTVASGTTLALRLPLSEPDPLFQDTSGDGVVDTPVAASPIAVTGPDAADTIPPTVTLSVSPDRVVIVSADDSTAVSGVYYSFDGVTFDAYSSPIPAPNSAVAVYAYADDSLGNRSPISSVLLAPDTTKPTTTILLEGPQDKSGAFIGEVIATIGATDTGSGVFKSYTSLNGGQTWQEYTAPLQVARGQATSVQAYSVDNVGNREDPPQVRDLVFAVAQTNLYLPAVQRSDVQAADTETSVEPSTVTAIYTATTGADGRYTFASLPAGTYEVAAQRDGWTFAPGKNTVTLTSTVTYANFTAQLILIDDFEQYVQDQPLGGQGDWINDNSCNVMVIASGLPQRGKIVRSSNCYYGQYVERPYQFGFSTDDQDVFIQFSGRITSGQGNNSGSSVILSPPTYTLGFGMATNPSLNWNFQPGIWTSSSTYLGQPLVPDTWYDFRLEIDWSHASSLGGYGLATLRYRPSGTTQWITEASLTNVELGVPNPSLLSTIGLRMDGIYSRRGELDNITFGRGN